MLLAILVGFAAGVLSGMGVGGGTLLVIYLTMAAGVAQKGAQGINLVYFIPCAASSAVMHFKNRLIDGEATICAVLAGVPLALLGAWAANSITEGTLRRIFGALLVATGCREMLKKKK